MQVHIVVSGIVQGVFYRRFTKEVADKYGVKGSVKNLPDGRVEIYAEQSEDIIQKFVEELKIGPPAAKVEDVAIKEISGMKFDSFEIIR